MSSDPAINAARRALDRMFYEGRIARALNNQVKDGALNGAREALAPLRNLHRPTYRYLHATGACIHDEHDTFEVANGDHVCRNCTDDDGGPQKVCAECLDEEGSNIDWPCATARLIYPEDDL